MSVVRLNEVTESRAVQVDRENGVIRGVRILGPDSRNRRRYTREAISAAKPQYENARVNFDHPPKSQPMKERTVSDRAGWLVNVREESGGLNGDLHLLKSDPRAEKVLEAAEKRPDLFGLSHNAEGRIEKRNGQDTVTEIVRVDSVDIVSDPATTRSLFESWEIPMKKSIREIAESVPQGTFGKSLLLEMTDEGGPMASAASSPVEMPAESSSDDQVKAAFRAAIVAAFDDDKLDTQATLSRMKEVMKAYDKLTGSGSEKKAEPPAAGDSETQESVQRKAAADHARELLEAAGIKADDAKVKALSAMTESVDRKALIESWRPSVNTNGKQPEKKKPSSSSVMESGSKPDMPKSVDDFVRAIT